MAKIYVFLADGCEEIEALTPVDLLRRAGHEVCTVSVMGRRQITGSHQIEITADAKIEEVDGSGGDVYLLPGGMPGTRYLGECGKLCSCSGRKIKRDAELRLSARRPAYWAVSDCCRGKRRSAIRDLRRNLPARRS